MKCSGCDRPAHTQGMCRSCYYRDYKLRRRRARVLAQKPTIEMPYHPTRRWEFTAQTWWSWWEKRRADDSTRCLRAGIDEFRARLR